MHSGQEYGGRLGCHVGLDEISSTHAQADLGHSLPVHGSRGRAERPSGTVGPREAEPDGGGRGWDAKRTGGIWGKLRHQQVCWVEVCGTTRMRVQREGLRPPQVCTEKRQKSCVMLQAGMGLIAVEDDGAVHVLSVSQAGLLLQAHRLPSCWED